MNFDFCHIHTASDRELAQLLVELAHSESQLDEPEQGSILSGHRTAVDTNTPEGGVDDGPDDADDGDSIMDALESLHMSQAWDEHTPNNELEDGYDEDEDDGSSDEEAGYNTAHR